MATINVVTEDKVIVVDGEAINHTFTFPANLWAIQWDGTEGHAEWTDGPNTVLTAADVAGYETQWTDTKVVQQAAKDTADAASAAAQAQATLDGADAAYIASTDSEVLRELERIYLSDSTLKTTRESRRPAHINGAHTFGVIPIEISNGLKGDNGATGAAGSNGATGSNGSNGSNGSQGAVGASFSKSGTTLYITT